MGNIKTKIGKLHIENGYRDLSFSCFMTLLPLTKGEVPYRLNVDFELIALSSVAGMALQAYALGKL